MVSAMDKVRAEERHAERQRQAGERLARENRKRREAEAKQRQRELERVAARTAKRSAELMGQWLALDDHSTEKAVQLQARALSAQATANRARERAWPS